MAKSPPMPHLCLLGTHLDNRIPGNVATGKAVAMRRFCMWFAEECEKRGLRWYHIVIYFAFVFALSSVVSYLTAASMLNRLIGS